MLRPLSYRVFHTKHHEDGVARICYIEVGKPETETLIGLIRDKDLWVFDFEALECISEEGLEIFKDRYSNVVFNKKFKGPIGLLKKM